MYYISGSQTVRCGAPGGRGLLTGAPSSFRINLNKTFGLTRQKQSVKLKMYLLFSFIYYLRLDIDKPKKFNFGTLEKI